MPDRESRASYYIVDVSNPASPGKAYKAECLDIIEALGMTFCEGEAFKSIWRMCASRHLGLHKDGGDPLYDARKVEFYACRILNKAKATNERDDTGNGA